MGNIKDLDGNDLYKSFYTGNGNVIYGSTEKGRQYFIVTLGYRWATDAEVNSALEAYTPGNVNKWVAVNPILPRNIPGTVNEYGFIHLQGAESSTIHTTGKMGNQLAAQKLVHGVGG